MAIATGCATRAQPPAGYYTNAEGKTGLALKAALHDIIDAHTVIMNNAEGLTEKILLANHNVCEDFEDWLGVMSAAKEVDQ